MNILVLDDNEYRHTIIRRQYVGHYVCNCSTYSAFEKALPTRKWTVAYLDFDLAQFNHNADFFFRKGKFVNFNGSHAAALICARAPADRPEKVVIHSVDGIGARHMCAMLREKNIYAILDPFLDLKRVK